MVHGDGEAEDERGAQMLIQARLKARTTPDWREAGRARPAKYLCCVLINGICA